MQTIKKNGSVLSIAALLLISGVFLVLYTYEEHKTFVEYQHESAQHSVSSTGEHIAVLVEGLKTSLTFFVKGHEAMLSQLARHPDDSEAHAPIDKVLSSHYPDYYAFTLADSAGHVIYDDFGERVADACRKDIQQFSRSQHPVDIYIHPGPGEDHIDLMLPWYFEGKKGIFFISFKVNAIANLLRDAQISGHKLMLLRTDNPNLIEVTADGSRTGRMESFRLSEQQHERILSTVPVAGTRWLLVDLADESLFPSKNIALAGQAGGVVTVFLLTGGIMMRRVLREERARYAAEEALLVSHEHLETRVSERTAELTGSNQKLQHEINRRRKLSRALEQTDDIVIITDLNGIAEYANPAFEKKTGIPVEEILGRKQSMVRSDKHDDAFYRRMWKHLNSGQVFRDIFINRRRDGSLYHEEKTITPLRDENGNVTHFVATGKDITEHIVAKKHIEKLAYHDALTGLPNRLLLLDRLEHALSHAEREENMIAVLFLDLDRFKTINDSLGHGVGDQLLKTMAERLCRCARDSDTVARLGGDEFAIILEGVRDVTDITTISQRMIDAVAQPATVDEHELHTTASIGIAIFPFEDKGVDSLLKNADTAMYRVKGQGGNGFEFYTTDMGVVANRRLTMESRLRGAMARNEFDIYYQPRIALKSGRVIGVEALLRWQSPELGAVSPMEFIPLLEETGQIMEVGEWVLRQACSEFGILYPDLRLAVNLSPRQFVQPELAQKITDILAETNFKPRHLDIEITESVLAYDPEGAIEILQRLHGAGIHIAIDDFGTGYSSLSYLKHFPIDCLKVDRSFVHNLADDTADVKLVTAIIAMAHSLNMTVVTEGIETAEQLAVVRDLGSEEGQGYLFSRPLPLAELETWFDTDRILINTA